MQGWIWRWANHLFQLSAILFVLFYFYRCVVLLDVIYINLRHHRRVVISIDSSSLIRINQHLVIVLGAYYCWSRRGVQCRGTYVDGSHVIIYMLLKQFNEMKLWFQAEQNTIGLESCPIPSIPSIQDKWSCQRWNPTHRSTTVETTMSPLSSLQSPEKSTYHCI